MLRLLDLSPNGNNATNVNSVSPSSQKLFGRYTGALFTRASGNYLTVPSSASLSPTSDLTIEAWVKLSQVGLRQGIFTKSGVSVSDYNFEINTSNQLLLGISANGSTNHNITSTGTLSVLTATHIAANFNSATGDIRLYINGVFDSTGNLGERGINAGGQIGYIGATESGTNSLDSIMQELRVWSVLKSDAAILANYNTALAGNEANLSMYQRLDNTSGGGGQIF